MRRERGEPGPWTTDPILAKYRFCNVRREDDRVTKWIDLNWRAINGLHNELWHRIWLSRVLNWPPTLAYLGYPEHWDPELILLHLVSWREAGNKVFSSAYIVSTNGIKMDKLEYVVQMLDEGLDLNNNPVSVTLAETHANLMQINGLGNFMAAQVVADLKYTEWLNSAPDWWNWAAPGPGSMRGLNRVRGNGPDDRKWRNPDFTEALMDLRGQLEGHTEWVPDLCLQDLQNCLCEFDKYQRIKAGGRVRATYKPHSYAV